jgi:hypothetical protein
MPRLALVNQNPQRVVFLQLTFHQSHASLGQAERPGKAQHAHLQATDAGRGIAAFKSQRCLDGLA